MTIGSYPFEVWERSSRITRLCKAVQLQLSRGKLWTEPTSRWIDWSFDTMPKYFERCCTSASTRVSPDVTLLELASASLGSQDGCFTRNHPQDHGIHIYIYVSIYKYKNIHIHINIHVHVNVIPFVHFSRKTQPGTFTFMMCD